MASFSYTPLVPPNNIRLIRALRGSGDILECTLHQVNLASEPIYEALSYTWGDNKRTKTIFIDAEEFPVTENLYQALQMLCSQSSSSPQSFWIDAICIDQSNTPERNAQVDIMGKIYKSAQHVVIWLGTATESDALGFKSMFELYTYMQSEARLKMWSQHPVQERAAALESFCGTHGTQWSPNGDAWKALGSVLERPWFKRIWILQEFVLARQATFICGEHTVNRDVPATVIRTIWQAAYGSYLRLQEHPTTIGPIHAISSMATFRDVVESQKQLQLITLMATTRDREATDSKDKVFALLSLATDTHDSSLHANYDLSLEEVLQKVVCFYLEKESSLDILSLVTYAEHRSHDLSNAPSWIPDITQSGMLYRISLTATFPSRFHASKGTPCSFSLLANKRVLSLKGIFIDIINSVADCESFIKSVNGTGSVEERLKVVSFFKECDTLASNQVQPYSTHELSEEVYWRTLVFNTDGNNQTPKSEYGMFYYAWRQALLLGLPVENAPQGRIDTDGARQFGSLMGRTGFSITSTLCVTSKGFLGSPPLSTRVGDMICVLFGGNVPFVVRPCEGTNEFILIGETYLHGFMQGEALDMEGAVAREFKLR